MIRLELEKSARAVGAYVVEGEGTQAIRMVRHLPKRIRLVCARCRASWWVAVSKTGRCGLGWRNCPRGCNARAVARHNRSAAA